MIFDIFWKTFGFSGNFGGFEISDILTFCVNWLQINVHSRENNVAQGVRRMYPYLRKTQTRDTIMSYSRENNLCTDSDLRKLISG